uniref:Retrovirus-related Pol polyprotein from transposon TNT 1-94 n=1 Tax=Tanacetum cinerariifolium TaxID=118510 RepID=A0A699HB88_TANCI|nr:hypothetical protein [Tanacetum cinerariifolium]
MPKPQTQWSNAEARLANHDKRLKSIIIYCLPNDAMKFVIKCKTAQSMWNDLILAHEGPFDTRYTKIDALRLKFNAFKALEGEKLNGTFTRLKTVTQMLKKTKGVSVNSLSIKKELCWLIRKYSTRGLGELGQLENPVTESKKPILLVDYKGKYKGLKVEMVVLTKKIDALTKGKIEKEKSEKGLIAESFDWDEESVSSEDEGTTKRIKIVRQLI